jgi:hypothetical protein
MPNNLHTAAAAEALMNGLAAEGAIDQFFLTPVSRN